MKNFYICSYGGCGSQMLTEKLKSYGKSYHIHSRLPPIKLEYVGKQNGGNSYGEWFNGIEVPEDELANYYVIYIYKNPIKSIYSRFQNPDHLRNIQLEPKIKLDDLIEKKKDLYRISEFYNNYLKKDVIRNYKIYCVKYEELFEKQEELEEILGIGKLNLVKRETGRSYNYEKELKELYKELIEDMENNNFLEIR